MSPIIPSRYGHPKYNIIPQKSRSTSQAGFKSAQRSIPGSESKYSRRKQRIEESKITVQSVDDDDNDNFFSKHLAAARFHRNHRLINVIFSDVVVEKEQISDNDKLQACRKRVKNLTDFQKKVDDELAEINTKFEERKARIIEEGQVFCKKLNEFVANSKRQIDVARAEKARYDQEQQRIQSTKVNNTISENESQANGKVIPMDCEKIQENGDTSGLVSKLLDDLIKSIPDSV